MHSYVACLSFTLVKAIKRYVIARNKQQLYFEIKEYISDLYDQYKRETRNYPIECKTVAQIGINNTTQLFIFIYNAYYESYNGINLLFITLIYCVKNECILNQVAC